MSQLSTRFLFAVSVLIVSVGYVSANDPVAVLKPSFEKIRSGVALSDKERVNLYGVMAQLSDEDFEQVNNNLTEVVRGSSNHDTALSLIHNLPSNFNEEQAARFEMMLYYDLMAQAEFQVAFQTLQSRIDFWQNWKPTADEGRNSKANLLHIYGQLLVRKEHVTEALGYFDQAEQLFKSLDPNHPSIFTIQVIVAEAYLQGEYYEKAVYFLDRAQELFPKDRTDGRSYVAALNARAHLNTQGPESALEIINEYLANPIDPREDYFLFFSLVHLEVLQNLEYTPEFLLLAEKTNELAKKIGNADYLKEASSYLGYAHYVEGHLDLAIRYLSNAVTKDSDIRNSVSLQTYKYLGEAYARNEDYREAYFTFRQYEKLLTERQERLNQRAIAEISAQYDLEKAQTQADSAQKEMKLVAEREASRVRYLKVLVALLVALVMSLIIILYSLYSIKRKNDQLGKLSVTDPLTQVGNRLGMAQDVAHHAPSLVCLVDIDKLKFYNDEYGHSVGDALIQHCIQMIKSHTKALDLRLYRLGGDEFVLLSNQVTREELTELLGTIERALQQQGYEHSGLSFGLAARSEAQDFRKLISLADQRMYEMKAEKRQNRVNL